MKFTIPEPISRASIAAAAGDTETLEALPLEEIDVPDVNANTPLIKAANAGHAGRQYGCSCGGVPHAISAGGNNDASTTRSET